MAPKRRTTGVITPTGWEKSMYSDSIDWIEMHGDFRSPDKKARDEAVLRRGLSKKQMLVPPSEWPRSKRALSHLSKARKMLLEVRTNPALREWTTSRTSLNAIDEAYNTIKNGDIRDAPGKIDEAYDWVRRWEDNYRKSWWNRYSAKREVTPGQGLGHIMNEIAAAKQSLGAIARQKVKKNSMLDRAVRMVRK